MTRRTLAQVLALVIQAAPVLGAGTVTLELSSPDEGMTVEPGVLIEWSITVTVSEGDNLGLAFMSLDLVQDPANFEKFDIPPAEGLPAGMESFDRPAGISNPGAGGSGSGYGGTPMGPEGQQDLRQIGGAQNTLGISGGSIGQDVDVDGGIGQGGAQIIATGSFAAPCLSGPYTFSIENAIANTLDAINAPPAFSPVSEAGVFISSGSISFTVDNVDCPQDLNCDGDVGPFDLAFVLGHWGPYPEDCPPFKPTDFNEDCDVGAFDLALVLGFWGPCPVNAEWNGGDWSAGIRIGMGGGGGCPMLEEALQLMGYSSTEEFIAWLMTAFPDRAHRAGRVLLLILTWLGC